MSINSDDWQKVPLGFSLESSGIWQNAVEMQRIQAEIKTLNPFEQQQVRLLATETTHSWASALEAVKAGDYHRPPTPARLMPRQLASINLPPSRPPKGQRLTRRQRRARR